MVAKQKGGVGATTLARELGVAAAAAGKRVVFVDLDPQGTLRGWWNRRTEGAAGDPNPGLATPAPTQLAAALERLRAAGVDLCVVDTPPSVHPFLGSVMRLADLILLPTRPTTDDLDALPAVLDLVEETGRPFAFVVVLSDSLCQHLRRLDRRVASAPSSSPTSALPLEISGCSIHGRPRASAPPRRLAPAPASVPAPRAPCGRGGGR
jgi:hypothetical protein